MTWFLFDMLGHMSKREDVFGVVWCDFWSFSVRYIRSFG